MLFPFNFSWSWIEILYSVECWWGKSLGNLGIIVGTFKFNRTLTDYQNFPFQMYGQSDYAKISHCQHFMQYSLSLQTF